LPERRSGADQRVDGLSAITALLALAVVPRPEARAARLRSDIVAAPA
jgi:hypothetical protein